jgi:hypothetical protein
VAAASLAAGFVEKTNLQAVAEIKHLLHVYDLRKMA